MSDLLSEEEIAALVEAAREGNIPEPRPEAPQRRTKRVRGVDFTRPTKFTQEYQRRLRRGHESFCRTASTQLSAELRMPIELEVINVDQQTWATAVSEIPQPSLYGVASTSVGGRLLASLEQSAAMLMIERLLGGAEAGKPVDRELTEIEIALARRVFATVLGPLSRNWEEMVGLSLVLTAVETQQASIQLVPSSEPTLAVTIEVRIERLSSTFTLLVPYRTVESVLEQLSAGRYGDHADGAADEQTEQAVRTALRGVEVEVRAEIGSRQMRIDEVLALQPGDVVRLGAASGGGTLYADAVAIHRVKPGRTGNRRAVEIVERIDPS